MIKKIISVISFNRIRNVNKTKKRIFFLIAALCALIYLFHIIIINNSCSKFVNLDRDFYLNKKIDNIFNLSFEDKIKLSEEVQDFSAKCGKPSFIVTIEKRGDNIVNNYHNTTNKNEINELTKIFTTHFTVYYLFHGKYGSETMFKINEKSMHEFLLTSSENLDIPLKYE